MQARAKAVIAAPIGLPQGPDDVELSIMAPLTRLAADTGYGEGAEDSEHLTIPLASEVLSQEVARFLCLLRSKVSGFTYGSGPTSF